MFYTCLSFILFTVATEAGGTHPTRMHTCYELDLPENLENVPQLGDIEDSNIIGYIIIANGEEITIITNEEEYLSRRYELHN